MSIYTRDDNARAYMSSLHGMVIVRRDRVDTLYPPALDMLDRNVVEGPRSPDSGQDS